MALLAGGSVYSAGCFQDSSSDSNDCNLYTDPNTQVPPSIQGLLAAEPHQTGPKAIYDSYGGLVVFARDTDGTLRFRRQIADSSTGTISGWLPYWEEAFNGGVYQLPEKVPYGGTMNSDPEPIGRGLVTVRAPSWYGGGSLVLTGGPADIFYVGNNRDIWHLEQFPDGSWDVPHAVNGSIGISPVAFPAAGNVTVAYDAANDQAQLFYTTTSGAIMTYTQKPHNQYWDSKPTELQPPGSSTSNITTIDAPNGKRYVAYRTRDNRVGIFSISPNSKTATGTPVIMGAPNTVASDITLAIDPNSGVDIFWRQNGQGGLTEWEAVAQNAPGEYCGGSSQGVMWCGNYWAQPLTNLGYAYISDIVPRYLMNGLIELWGVSQDYGLTFLAQNATPGGTIRSYSGWQKHFHILGRTAQVANSSGMTLLSQSVYSIPNLIAGINGLENVFYVGANGNIYFVSEMIPSTLNNPYPVMQNPVGPKDPANVIPAWSQPMDLGGNGIFAETAGGVPINFGLTATASNR